MKNPLILVSLLMTLNTFGCSYAMEEVGLFKTGDVKIPNVGTLDADTRVVDFETLKVTAWKSCLDCHSGGVSPQMTSPGQIMANEAKVRELTASGAMPPARRGYKPLTACEKSILETFLTDQNESRAASIKINELPACAEVQTEPEQTPAPKPSPTLSPSPTMDLSILELSFDNLTKHVLENKCLGCHGTFTARKTILDDLAEIEGAGILKATAEESVLYQVVVPGLNKRFMPPAGRGTPLTEEEVSYLKRWIDSRQDSASRSKAAQ